jgi:transcriptional regulator with XRE-family HTH domain
MIHVKTLCQELGLSHQQLASFINCDRSLISKSQRGERPLSADTMLLLYRMYTVYINMSGTPFFQIANDQQLQEWEIRLHGCRLRKAMMQRRLAKLVQQFQKATRMLQWLEALNNEQSIKPTSRQQRWMEERRYEARNILSKCHGGYQRTLQTDILLAETEIRLLEEAKAKLVKQEV